MGSDWLPVLGERETPGLLCGEAIQGRKDRQLPTLLVRKLLAEALCRGRRKWRQVDEPGLDPEGTEGS